MLLSFLVTGCTKEENNTCKGRDCVNGNCIDGICQCDTGYEGNHCLYQVRAKFIGTFTGNEACTITGTEIYSIIIEPNDTNVAAVNFRNLRSFGDFTCTSGNIGTDGNVYIPRQKMGGNYPWITGKAMILNGKLKISYSFEDSGTFGNQTDNCVWQQE